MKGYVVGLNISDDYRHTDGPMDKKRTIDRFDRMKNRGIRLSMIF